MNYKLGDTVEYKGNEGNNKVGTIYRLLPDRGYGEMVTVRFKDSNGYSQRTPVKVKDIIRTIQQSNGGGKRRRITKKRKTKKRKTKKRKTKKRKTKRN